MYGQACIGMNSVHSINRPDIDKLDMNSIYKLNVDWKYCNYGGIHCINIVNAFNCTQRPKLRTGYLSVEPFGSFLNLASLESSFTSLPSDVSSFRVVHLQSHCDN